MKKTIIAVVVIVIIIALAAMGLYMYQQNRDEDAQPPEQSQQDSEATDEATDENATTSDVKIVDFTFSPADITIKKGETVTWTNQDSVGHNVIADNAEKSGGLPLDSPLLAQGESFSHTFTEVGEFSYHCQPHPNMRGTVTVVE